MENIFFNSIYKTYFYVKYQVWWQFGNLKSFHEIFLVSFIFFLSDGIKLIQKCIQIYLEIKGDF